MTNKTLDSKIFYDTFRKHYGKITQRQVDALNRFNKSVIREQGMFTLQEWAYIYATVYWETGFTFEGVRESPRQTEAWRKKKFYYYPYYGRGYVQLTHERNYALFSKIMGIDLVGNPDLALEHENAFFILTYGCKHGLYTGRKIGFYMQPDGSFDAINARRVINGTDKAREIASHYEKFRDILQNSLSENQLPV